MKDYVDVVYNDKNRPISSYPDKLAKYLFDKYNFKKGQTIIEPGCGRGEFLYGFHKLGLLCTGIDLSLKGSSITKEINFIGGVNVEKDKWPFQDNSVDIIYSKSLIEHLYNPELFLLESKRVLKKGGKILCLTPDWETCYKKFYDDYTHRSPFTNLGFNQLLQICDFSESSVIKFRQLPIVWKYPYINLICGFIAPFVPVRTQNKFLRWSRELMLVGYAVK